MADVPGSCSVSVDREKIESYSGIYRTGLDNYALFQKFSDFRWPAWIGAMTGPGERSVPVPLVLVNTVMRDCLYFTNFLSRHGLLVDPAGMISPSHARWSLETWLAMGDEIVRPADDWSRVKLERDVRNSTVHITWDTGVFRVTQSLYGARTSVDEAVIETECVVRERAKASLLFVVRPYNRLTLGGLDTVEFAKDGFTLVVNGRREVCFAERADLVMSAGGDRCRDIDPHDEDRAFRSHSPHGMATLAVGYRLKKGENRLAARVSLDERGGLAAGAFDLKRVKADYTEFASVRIRNGANATIHDRTLQGWFYGLKTALLNVSFRDILASDGTVDYRAAHRVTFGMNRMGYFPESLKLVDHILKTFAPDEKRASFGDVIDACHVVEATADYFTHLRDTGFLQNRFEAIAGAARLVYRHSRGMKKPGSGTMNSLPDYLIEEEHPLDALLIAHALAQHAYLARCLGIFGEEIRFRKESDRLAGIAVKAAFDPAPAENQSVLYNLLGGFPFRVDAVTDEHIRRLMERLKRHFDGIPLYVKPLGWDVATTLVAAINLFGLKNPEGLEIVKKLFGMRGKTYALPDYMNPSTGRASWGDGASPAAAAMAFAAIRSLLFLDHPERLELFPVPPPDWFEAGAALTIEDVPSRFGLISFRMVATVNEVQVHLDRLPKFVPPEIMINLPHRFKIKQEDDFIVKREHDRSVIINGWPSIVRFIRK